MPKVLHPVGGLAEIPHEIYIVKGTPLGLSLPALFNRHSPSSEAELDADKIDADE